MREIRIFDSKEQLIVGAADLFVDLAKAAIDARGRFVASLSGGSTPKPIYEYIAANHGDTLDWAQTSFFLGDERNVPDDSPESNFAMANEALFSPLLLQPGQVHSWPTHLRDAAAIASAYADELRWSFTDLPRFDLFLLGLGNDGHTASLFPNTAALKETESITAANWVEKLGTYRLTMTFPVINNSANAIFVVSGEDKAPTVADVLEGEFRPDDLPAQFVNPTDGELVWLLDRAAASKL